MKSFGLFKKGFSGVLNKNESKSPLRNSSSAPTLPTAQPANSPAREVRLSSQGHYQVIERSGQGEFHVPEDKDNQNRPYVNLSNKIPLATKQTATHAATPNANTTGTVWVSPFSAHVLDDEERVNMEDLHFQVLQNQIGTNLKMASVINNQQAVACFLKPISKLVWRQLDNPEKKISQIKKMPHHQNILQVKGYAASESLFFMVYEFTPSLTSLSEFIKTQQSAPPLSLRVKWLFEIAYSLAHLHANGIKHGNLTPDNILVDTRDNRIRLSEYGFTSGLFMNDWRGSLERDDTLDFMAIFQEFFTELPNEITQILPSFLTPYLQANLEKLIVGPSPRELVQLFEQLNNWVLDNGELLTAPITGAKPEAPNLASQYSTRLKLKEVVPSFHSDSSERSTDSRNLADPHAIHRFTSDPDDPSMRSYQNSAQTLLEAMSPKKAAAKNIAPEILGAFHSPFLPWSEFATMAKRFAEAQTELLEELKFVLAVKSNVVTKEDWEKFISWFSPLYHCLTVSEEMPEPGFTLHDAVRIICNPWFFGWMSTIESVEALWGKPFGTFMLRFSSLPGHYALSVSSGTQVGHWRIKATPTKAGIQFSIDDRHYSSLQLLIQAHGVEPLQLLNSPDPSKTINLLHPMSRTSSK